MGRTFGELGCCKNFLALKRVRGSEQHRLKQLSQAELSLVKQGSEKALHLIKTLPRICTTYIPGFADNLDCFVSNQKLYKKRFYLCKSVIGGRKKKDVSVSMEMDVTLVCTQILLKVAS